MSVINKQAYGVGNPIFGVQQKPIIAEVDPVRQKAQLGTLWINTAVDTAFVLTAVVAGVPVWTNLAGGAGFFTSLTVNPGNLTVTAGNIVATAGSITAGTTVTAGTGMEILTGSLIIDSGNALVSNRSVSATSSALSLNKSRAGGVIVTGDDIGAVVFNASDGVTVQTGAAIVATSTGTIAAGRVPTNLIFSTTPDAVSGDIDRLTIPAAGGLVIAAPTGATTPPLVLPGPINIYTGAGAPAGGLAIHVGDLYINTTAASAVTRMYIATAAGVWTNFTCAA